MTGLLRAAAAASLLAGCGGATLSVIDPAFGYLVPDAERLFGRGGAEVIVLPYAGAEAALFAAVDERSPSVVYLSPLLSREISPILAADGAVRIAYLGETAPAGDERLYSARFDAADAARLAGEILAKESKLSAARGRGPRVAAVFALDEGGAEGAEGAEAFLEAFAAAGGLGEPVVERTGGDFSESMARSLRDLDIGCAYLCCGPADVERWAEAAFDGSAYIVAMSPFAVPEDLRSVDAALRWDIGTTLQGLAGRIAAGEHGPGPGSWSVVTRDE